MLVNASIRKRENLKDKDKDKEKAKLLTRHCNNVWTPSLKGKMMMIAFQGIMVKAK
jgi:hypothetical protein